MTAHPLDLGARGAELRQRITGLEDDARRLERRRDELDRERREVEQRLSITADSIESTERKIEEARQELERIEELVGNTAPRLRAVPNGRPELHSDQVRAAILRFQGGTVADVAAYLRRKPTEIAPLMEAEAEAGIIRFTGAKLARSPVWEYVPPSEPGAAFEVQQEARRPHDDKPRAEPVEGANDHLIAAMAKGLRRPVKAAVSAGFTLSETGSNHLMLSRPDAEPFTFSKFPNDAKGIGRRIAAHVRRAGVERVQRGAAVAGTGRPLQRTGSVNAKRAEQSARRVVKRK